MTITIDEAIQELTYLTNSGPPYPDQPRIDAARLGIEALKRVKENRETIPTKHTWLLPGETEKND